MNYPHKFWEKYFKYYDCLMQLIPYQLLLKKMATLIRNDRELKLLDLGAGTGNIQYFLKGPIEVTSFDNSKEALERLQHKFPNQETIQGSIVEPLPFQDQSFDAIFSNNVLYTLPKEILPTVVGEMKRVLKPGGRIIVSNLTHGFSPLKIYREHIKMHKKAHGSLSTLVHLLKMLWPTIRIFQLNRVIQKNGAAGDYHFFGKEEQRQIFSKSGFTNLIPTQHVYANQAALNVFQL